MLICEDQCQAWPVLQLVDGGGLCLGVQYKSEDSQNLLLAVDSCTKKDDGQFWSFASSLVENPTSKQFNVKFLFLYVQWNLMQIN